MPFGTAITNVTLIDAVNGVRENQTIVFDGDEVTAIQASGSELSVVETIDGTGKFLIPGLFVAYVLQRIWTWLWISWNTRKAMARRLSLERGATTYHPADGEAVDQQWRNHLNSKNE